MCLSLNKCTCMGQWVINYLTMVYYQIKHFTEWDRIIFDTN